MKATADCKKRKASNDPYPCSQTLRRRQVPPIERSYAMPAGPAGFSITDIPQDVEEFGGAPKQDDGRFEVTFQDLQEPMKLDEIERWLLSDQDTVLPWALNLNLLYVIGKHMLCMM
jgi:hypothetical protein